MLSISHSRTLTFLVNIEQGLQLDNQLPLLIRHVLAIEFLETVDAGTRDQAVQSIRFLKMSTVDRLVSAHFNLDGN
jgi:uncharacterized membrane protein